MVLGICIAAYCLIGLYGARLAYADCVETNYFARSGDLIWPPGSFAILGFMFWWLMLLWLIVKLTIVKFVTDKGNKIQAKFDLEDQDRNYWEDQLKNGSQAEQDIARDWLARH